MECGEGLAVPEISALVPCLNEEENAAAIAQAIGRELSAVCSSYEIVFIDNGSSDRTVEIVKALCASDRRIRLIVNTRNFGQMRSPTYGIYQASASGAVIGISADFQDPPELIARFVGAWRAGAMIVLGVRASEKTSLILRTLRTIGYGFFERFADYRVIPGATGFGLYDRRVVDCLKQWRDPEPFFRGMLVESGYDVTTIEYHRPQRERGVSKNNLASIFVFAIAGLASSSKKLLRLPIYISIAIFLTTLLTVLIAIVWTLLGHSPWLVIIFAVGQLALAALYLFVGLIGEQTRMIAEMVRNTPLVIEKERVNFPPVVNKPPRSVI